MTMGDEEFKCSAAQPRGLAETMQHIERYIRSSRFDSLKGDADDHITRRITEIEGRIERISAEVSFFLFLSSTTLAVLIAMLIAKATA